MDSTGEESALLPDAGEDSDKDPVLLTPAAQRFVDLRAFVPDKPHFLGMSSALDRTRNLVFLWDLTSGIANGVYLALYT